MGEKKHRTLENVDVQEICHMYSTETFYIYNKYPWMEIQNQEIILQSFLMLTIQSEHIQQSASVCHIHLQNSTYGLHNQYTALETS